MRYWPGEDERAGEGGEVRGAAKSEEAEAMIRVRVPPPPPHGSENEEEEEEAKREREEEEGEGRLKICRPLGPEKTEEVEGRAAPHFAARIRE